MSAVISLAEARRSPEPPGIDWKLFEAFCDRVVIEPGDPVGDDFRERLLSLECELIAGNDVAKRYWRLVADEMRRPLRAPLPGDELNSAHVDKIVLVGALLFHWTCRHASRVA